MTPRTLWVGGLALAQAAALAASFPTSIGTQWWHHVASLLVVLVGVTLLAALRPRTWQSRRFLGIGILATTVLAVLSGFYLLYWKEGIRIDGYQDWGVFWHVAWSWAAAAFFFQHTWVNRVAFGHFWRRSWNGIRAVATHGGIYLLSAVVLVVTLGPGRTWFTNENYIPLSLWTWFAATGVAYVLWWVLRLRANSTQLAWRGRVDLALVPLAAVATVSGIPLLWLDPWTGPLGLQYATKAWHVVPSIVFTILVYVHSVQLWTGLRRHWQRLGAARDTA